VQRRETIGSTEIQHANMTTYEAGDTLDHYRIEAAVAHSGMSML